MAAIMTPAYTRVPLPPGPDARVKITEEYAKAVARDAYFWAWPMVNVYNRRLVFAQFRKSPEQHLARLQLADLFLDTLPYNAHTTASDALWAGLPVVTCAGETFAARVAGSLLHANGLPELVTHTLADYEALALRLARDPAALGALREQLGEVGIHRPHRTQRRRIMRPTTTQGSRPWCDSSR